MKKKFSKRNLLIGLGIITVISFCFYSNSMKPLTVILPEETSMSPLDIRMSPLKRKLVNKLFQLFT